MALGSLREQSRVISHDGVAAWNLQTEGLQQNDLILTQQEDALLTVDNIEVAQFVYLMHKNEKLRNIIPLLPSVPVQPILLASDRGYAMFEHWRGFNSVLPEFLYENEQHLLNNLDAKLIGPVNTWQKEQNRVAALEEKIKALEAKHAQQR